jgi:hypothetical protein
MRRMRTRALMSSVACAALLACAAAPVATAESTVNVSGVWQATYHCAVGPCAGTDHVGTLTLTQAAGSATVGGVISGLEIEGTASGSLAGNVLTLEGFGQAGYIAKGKETISADGHSWSGSFEDNHGTSGTFTATREVVPVALRASAIEVICNFEVAPSTFTCTAQVGDASEAAPAKIPSGTVGFTAPTGGFAPTSSCALKPTPSSPNVSFCSVTFVPPSGGIPTGTLVPVTGAYSGDSTFATSTAAAGTGPHVTASSASPVVEGASTTVSCPEGAVSCPVTAALSVTETGGAVTASAKKHTITIGQTSTVLGAGQKRKITVKLNRAGKRLLARHAHLVALLKVTVDGRAVRSQRVTIKPKHSAKHH